MMSKEIANPIKHLTKITFLLIILDGSDNYGKNNIN